MNSLPAHQRTMLTSDGTGLRNEPIPGMEVCDFCTATPVTHAYPCGEVQLVIGATNDPWAACDACHALIEADDRNALAERAADAQAGIPREVYVRLVLELHNGFFAARTGSPVRV